MFLKVCPQTGRLSLGNCSTRLLSQRFLNHSQSFACSGGSGADRCLILSNTFILFLMCSADPPAACPCPRSAISKHLSAVKLSATVDARCSSRHC